MYDDNQYIEAVPPGLIYLPSSITVEKLMKALIVPSNKKEKKIETDINVILKKFGVRLSDQFQF